jgi:hypothetical protein
MDTITHKRKKQEGKIKTQMILFFHILSFEILDEKIGLKSFINITFF